MSKFWASLAAGLCLAAPGARAEVITFDEFTGVGCCYGDTGGVRGPLDLPLAVVQDGNGDGQVLSGDGFNHLQTSGDNLFASLRGYSIEVIFKTEVSHLSFDVFDGGGSDLMRAELFDVDGALLGTQSIFVDFYLSGRNVVGHFTPVGSGVRRLVIRGSDNFGVDTIRFDVDPVPEPSTWVAMITGFFGLGAAIRRTRPRPFAQRVQDRY